RDRHGGRRPALRQLHAPRGDVGNDARRGIVVLGIHRLRAELGGVPVDRVRGAAWRSREILERDRDRVRGDDRGAGRRRLSRRCAEPAHDASVAEGLVAHFAVGRTARCAVDGVGAVAAGERPAARPHRGDERRRRGPLVVAAGNDDGGAASRHQSCRCARYAAVTLNTPSRWHVRCPFVFVGVPHHTPHTPRRDLENMTYRSELMLSFAAAGAVALAACIGKPSAKAATPDSTSAHASVSPAGNAANGTAGGDVVSSDSTAASRAYAIAGPVSLTAFLKSDTNSMNLNPGRTKADEAEYRSAIRAGAKKVDTWPKGPT